MTPGDIVKILTVAGPSLSAHGIIGADGQFVKQSLIVEVEDAAAVAQDVEAALKTAGLVVPAQIDKLIAILPSALTLVGQVVG